MGGHTAMLSLLGSYDNLGEAEPSWNYPETIITVSVVFLVLLYLCVGFRIYTRFRVIYSPGWDDLFVVLVCIFSSIGSICVCLATGHGLGQHFILLKYAEMMQYLTYFYVANATYSGSTSFVKISLLLQYLRLFKNEPQMRLLCQIVMCFTALWGLGYSFISWFPCFPVNGYYTWAVASSCYGFGSQNPNEFFATYASHAGINMCLDFIVLMIPVPLYFRKNTQSETKMGLLALLFMGGCVNFLSIWKLATIISHRAATAPTLDPTWYGPISLLLAVVEVDVAGICASVPVFWPVITTKINQIFVTQEIKIERTHRFSAMQEEEYELERADTKNNIAIQQGQSSLHSRATSEEVLNEADRDMEIRAGVTDAHYLDRYVAAQVDPLSSVGGVESEITAQVQRKKYKMGF